MLVEVSRVIGANERGLEDNMPITEHNVSKAIKRYFPGGDYRFPDVTMLKQYVMWLRDGESITFTTFRLKPNARRTLFFVEAMPL